MSKLVLSLKHPGHGLFWHWEAISYKDYKVASARRRLDWFLPRLRTQVSQHVFMGHLNDRNLRADQ